MNEREAILLVHDTIKGLKQYTTINPSEWNFRMENNNIILEDNSGNIINLTVSVSSTFDEVTHELHNA